MNKRVILVGPSASGKNFIREKFILRGYKADISYTSRLPRETEKDAVDYHFISKEDFLKMIKDDLFYEWVQYGDTYYGTGRYQWENSDIFIMETLGVQTIHSKDREHSLVIFVDTPLEIRIQRMKERGWNKKQIEERIHIDKVFEEFTNYDFAISSNKS